MPRVLSEKEIKSGDYYVTTFHKATGEQVVINAKDLLPENKKTKKKTK